jgi:CDP-paratose 2-epimerase
MKVLVTGGCGFVGSQIATGLREWSENGSVVVVDNLSRPGSEINVAELDRAGVSVVRGDIRLASDVDSFPVADWVIDASANASVLGGTSGGSSSRQLVETNLLGTLNLLEYCRRHGAGFTLLSSSRVYSVDALTRLPLVEADTRYVLATSADMPSGASIHGIAESFSTSPPLSLYGTTKLSSELLALEYGSAFGFPVWVVRSGVLAGAGQFGRADQGIFAYWINAYLRREPLRYVGFQGLGHQVRDGLHPRDLVPLLIRQMSKPERSMPSVVNVGGGADNAISLAELSAWCASRFGSHQVLADPAPRLYDVAWLVMDTRLAASTWDWRPQTPLFSILEEIAEHATRHPEWLSIAGPR